MTEPLSVAASIVGILAAASKVAEVLGPVVTSLKDTPKTVTAIYAEVSSARIILAALQTLFNDLERSPKRRRELIQVDQLIATLTDGALIFSELEPHVLRFGTSADKLRARLQWARKKDVLDSYVSRLQLFKGSINIMLTILQCESDMDASRKQHELFLLTTTLLQSNNALAHRLSLVENHIRSDEASEISTIAARRSSIGNVVSQIRAFGFEHDLEGTRVYRKARRSTCDASFRSSLALSHAWSVLSDASLSDISAISVVALPLVHSDLTNGHYYQLESNHATTPAAQNPKTQIESVTQSILDYLDTEQVTPIELPQEYKIVVLAGGGVDRQSFEENLSWEFDFRPGLADIEKIPMCKTGGAIGRFEVLPHITDQEVHSAMRQNRTRDADGFVVAYSVTSRASFEEAETLVQQILHVKDLRFFPMIIVGNHCRVEHSDRQVSHEEGEALATTYGCPFREVQVDELYNHHIDQVAAALHGEIMDFKKTTWSMWWKPRRLRDEEAKRILATRKKMIGMGHDLGRDRREIPKLDVIKETTKSRSREFEHEIEEILQRWG